MKRIALLTSGGDCQSLNAAMRAVAKSLYEANEEIKIFGFLNGYKGLIEYDYIEMDSDDFSGILTIGGTIIGTSRQPFKTIGLPDHHGLDKVNAMVCNYHKLNLDCLVILGGNGTHKTANLLKQEGLNIITLPKTIDNDLWGTDITFGFQSAVDIATQTIDTIHTTAASHGRVFIVELMGHKVGWLTLYAGLAGGADIILIPEIPYNLQAISKTIQKRLNHGKKFTIIAVAEGVKSVEDAKLKKKDYKEKMKLLPYPSISYKIGKEIEEITGQEVRIVIPGHTQRGGSPCPYDRILATRLGIGAAELIQREQYGYMVGIQNNYIVPVALEEVAGKLKSVNINHSIIKEAKELGIQFGDEV